MKNVIKGLAIAGLLATLAVPAFAQVTIPGNGGGTTVPAPLTTTAGPNTIYNILANVMNIAFIVLMLLAVLFIIIAGFNYLAAGGDEEKVEKAQRQLLYAVIAIVIGLLAKAVPLIVAQFLQGNV